MKNVKIRSFKIYAFDRPFIAALREDFYANTRILIF